MKVKQMIEILQTMDQEAVVNVYNGYCPEYGDIYKSEFELVEKALDWKDGKAVTVSVYWLASVTFKTR